jgi:hypothetical protein
MRAACAAAAAGATAGPIVRSTAITVWLVHDLQMLFDPLVDGASACRRISTGSPRRHDHRSSRGAAGWQHAGDRRRRPARRTFT